MKKISCFCGNEFEVDFPETADLDNHPEFTEQILNGTFLTAACTRCGKIMKPEMQISVSSNSKGLNLLFLPGLERNAFLLGTREYPEADRIIFGYDELVEKVRIMKAGLDDEILEIIKFHLLEKTDPTIDVTIYYEKSEDGSLLFHILGLKKDKVGISKISGQLYNRISDDMPKHRKNEPYATILSPPYISIRKIELEQA